MMATEVTQKFLQEHFRKHDSLTLYKTDGTPVTIVKVYEPVLIAGQYESYRFRSKEKLAEFCNKHKIQAHPTITLG